VSGWQELALFAAFGLIFSWAFTFCVNLIRVPKILHCELAEENRKLKSVAYPDVAADEQRRRQFVQNLMQRYGAGGRKVIQFVLDTGISNAQAMFNAGLPGDLTTTLNDAMTDGILELDRGSGRYSIKSELCSAIGFVLEHWVDTDHP